MQGAKAGAGMLLGLQVTGDLTINRYSFGPTCGSASAPHYIPWKKLNAGEQTAHSPHVTVPISLDLVVKVSKDEQFVVKGLKRFKNGFMLEVLANSFRPKMLRNGAVGTEHDHQSLLGETLATRFRKERICLRENGQR